MARFQYVSKPRDYLDIVYRLHFYNICRSCRSATYTHEKRETLVSRDKVPYNIAAITAINMVDVLSGNVSSPDEYILLCDPCFT